MRYATFINNKSKQEQAKIEENKKKGLPFGQTQVVEIGA